MQVKGGFIEDVADDIEGRPGTGEYWKNGGKSVGGVGGVKGNREGKWRKISCVRDGRVTAKPGQLCRC